MSLTLSNGNVLVNHVSTGTALLDWKNVTYSSGSLTTLSNIDDTTSLQVGGTIALDLSGFVDAAGSASFAQQTVSGTTDAAVNGDKALVLTLSAFDVFAGIGGSLSGSTVVPGSFGVSATGVSGTIASIADKTTAGLTFTGVDITVGTASIVGVPSSVMTLSVAGAHAQFNGASTGTTKLDWANLVAGGLFGVNVPATTDLALSATTFATSVAGGVAVLSGGFSMIKSTVSGSDGTISFTNAPAIEIDISGLQGWVGLGGSLDSNDNVVAGTVGISVTGGSLTIEDIQSSSTLSYLGVQGSALAGNSVGLDPVSLALSDAGVLVNHVSTGTALLDWKAITYTSGSLTTLTTLDNTISLEVQGTIALNLSGFVVASGMAAFAEQTVSGTSDASVNGDKALVLTLTGFDLFAGIGGSLTGTTVNPGSFGVSATGVSGSIASVVDKTTAGLTFTGVDITVGKASIVGVPSSVLTLTVAGAHAQFNGHSSGTANLDWASLAAGGLFGVNVAASTDLALSATTFATSVAGGVAVLSGGFSMIKSTVSGSDGTISFTNAPAIEIDVSGLQGWVGFGGSLDSNDNVVNGTIGISVTGGSLTVEDIQQSSTLSYLGVAASGLTGTSVGLAPVTVTLVDGTVLANHVSTGTALLDWKNVAYTSGSLTPLTTLDKSTTLSVGGAVTIDVGGIVSGSATIALTKQTVTIASLGSLSAQLLLVTVTAPTLTVGTGAFGLSFGGSTATVTLASVRPTSKTDNRSWLGLEAKNLQGSLTIGSLVTAMLSVNLAINAASPTGTNALDWPTDVPAAGLDLNGTTALSVSGSLSNLSIAGLITGSTDFSVTKTLVNVSSVTPALTNAPLLTLTLSKLSLSVGTAALGLQITGGTVAFASLAPASSADHRSWVGFAGSGLGASLTVPGVAASVANLSIQVNKASPTGTTALDWSTVSAAPTAIQALKVDILAASGELDNLNIFGLLTGSAMFTVADQQADVNLDGTAGIQAGGTDLINATLLTLSVDLGTVADGFSLTAGISGFGLTIPTGSIAIAALSSGVTGDGRGWTAVQATNLSASLNLPVLGSLTLSNVSIDVNRASGGASAIDWTKDVFTPGTPSTSLTPTKMAVTAGSQTIGLTGATLAVNGHIDPIAVLNGFLTLSGDFSMSQSAITIAVADNEPADLLTFGLSNVNVTVGDTSGPHLTATGGSIAIAAIAPTTAGDSARWMAIEGSLTGASFTGVSGISMTVSKFNLQINEASGQYKPGGTGTAVDAQALDWTRALNLNSDTTFGGPADQLTINSTPIDMSGSQLQASGAATVSLASGLVTGAVQFSFSQTVVNADLTANGQYTGQPTPTTSARGPPNFLVDATLTRIGLYILPAGISVGLGGTGLNITSGTLAIAALTPSKADQTAGDTRSWLAATAQLGAASLSLGGLKIDLSSLGIQINQASGAFSGTQATALNWTTAIDPNQGATFTPQPVTVTENPPSGAVTQTIGFKTASTFVTGQGTVNAFGFVSGSVGFALSHTTANITLPNGGGTLTNANVALISLTLNDVIVGVPGVVGLELKSGALDLAVVTPAKGSATTGTWIGLKGSVTGGSFFGLPDLGLTLDSLTVTINRGPTGTADALNWSTAGNTQTVTNPDGSTTTIDMATGIQQASGVTELNNVFGLITGKLGFSFSTQTVNVSSLSLTNATLTSLSLQFGDPGDNLFLGVNGIGFTAQKGSLDVAILTPASATDKRSWTAIASSLSNLSFDFGGSSALSMTVNTLAVNINKASPAGTTALNWSTVSQAPAGVQALTGPLVQLLAGGTLQIGNFVYVNGTFAFTNPGPTDVTLSGATTTTNVSLLEIGVTGNAFAGMGSPLDGSGNFTPSTTGAVGVSVSNVQFGLALMKETAGATPRSFYALAGSGSAELDGVSGITLSGTLAFDVNGGSVAGTAVDFTQLPGNMLKIPTGLTTSISITDSGPALVVSGSATISLEQFAYVSGSFALDLSGQKSAAQTFTLSNGDTGAANYLTVGISSGFAFFGVGGPYWDGKGGTVAGSDQAMGLAISNVSLGLALIKPTAGSALTTKDQITSALALELSGGVQLVGITGITASIQNASVSINEAKTASGTATTAVNFVKTFPNTTTPSQSGLSVPTGGTPVLINAAAPVFKASGDIALSFGSFFYISGTVEFDKGVAYAATTSAGKSVAMTALTIGAANVNAFVGVNGPYYAPDGTLDPSSGSAIGVALQGVNFGLALLKPTAASTSSYYALKATVGAASVVGVPGLGLTVKTLEVDINGSNGTDVVDFSKAPLAVSAGSKSIGLDFAGSEGKLLQASGNVTLQVGGTSGVSVSGDVFFQQSTPADGSKAIQLAIIDLSVTLGDPASPTFSHTFKNTDGTPLGLFFFTANGAAGQLTFNGLSFSIGGSSANFSLSGDLSFAFNTGTAAVNNEKFNLPGGTSTTLNVPAGPFLGLTFSNAKLNVTVGPISAELDGTYELEQVTIGTTKYVRLAATGVTLATSFTDPNAGSVSLTHGQGALILVPGGGIAGVFTGDFTLGVSTFLKGNAQAELDINTSGTNINQTVTVGGSAITVDVSAHTFQLSLTNVDISFGDYLTLTGNFTTKSGAASGETLYGATAVTIFFGQGPYKLADGSINPDAIGLLLSNATLGAATFADAPGTFALQATGTVSLVGLDGLTITDKTLTLLVNTTGHAVTDTIVMPASSGTPPVTMNFTTGAYMEKVVATGIVISAANVVTISGDVTFTRMADGTVNVDIPLAKFDISIPINGTLTDAFGLQGHAQFSFGGAAGFQLQSLTVNGATIFGQTLAIPSPPTPKPPPTATLVSPYQGQNIDAAVLNAQGYIDVMYTDNSGSGLNVATILDNTAEFTLGGAAASGVTVNGKPTQVDPINNPGLFRYSFTGQFTTPSNANDPYNTVTLQFTPGAFADMNGDANVGSYSTFYVFDPPTPPPTAPSVPTVTLIGPSNGSTISVDRLSARPYIDVTFSAGVDGATISNLLPSAISLSGPGTSNLFLDANGVPLQPNGGSSGTPAIPQLLSATTYRFFLYPKTAVDPSAMFLAGEIDVNFRAIARDLKPTWPRPPAHHVNAPAASPALRRPAVRHDGQHEQMPRSGGSRSPVTLMSPSIGLGERCSRTAS